MTAECEACGRPLRRPSPDGYGPVCRRKHRPPTAVTGPVGGRELLDHTALAAAGQLAIPIQPVLPAPRARRRWPARHQGRRVRTLPDIATWPKETS